MHSAVWARRAALGGEVGEQEGQEEEEEQGKKRKKASGSSKHHPISEVMRETELPAWASNVQSEDSFEYQTLFCCACGSFLDLKQSKGADVKCRKCAFVTKCAPGSVLMSSHAVVKFPAHKAWMDKLERLASANKMKVGNQRAEVSEECPKCKFPKMFFWTQQLRSADEGQTVFYECGNCTHRYSVNT
jgi:DNA-directed RNA polymerase subunit M/transcription elongation factor TFIIS